MWIDDLKSRGLLDVSLTNNSGRNILNLILSKACPPETTK